MEWRLEWEDCITIQVLVDLMELLEVILLE